ncbi:hypothetical protein BRC92_02005 [Halobacteriales archaeon QS_4_69_31]|nr:MAG: hypothetical protein BRC92_02005 [Halobacteriales archaeon QS_4_69_31]
MSTGPHKPVEGVFAFMDDPENHVTVTPSLAAVRNVGRLDNGGKRPEHTFRMAGVSLDGELELTFANVKAHPETGA